MNLLQKIKKALYILNKDGLGRFFKVIFTYLLEVFGKSFEPDETKLVFNVLQAKCQNGVMVDVGAHFGTTLAPFANCGWEVYAFEPDASNREKLVSQFGHSNNVHVDPRAVSDQDGLDVNFYTSKESSGISGLSAFHPSHEISDVVSTVTLEHFIKQHKIKTVDFLKIDTEGFDLLVLKGFPWDNITPQVVVCEFEDSKTEPLGYKFQDLAEFLEERGYQLLISEWFPINKYGECHEWRSFSPYPCSLQDEKAWGNIIAIKDQDTFNALVNLCQKIKKTADNRWEIIK